MIVSAFGTVVHLQEHLVGWVLGTVSKTDITYRDWSLREGGRREQASFRPFQKENLIQEYQIIFVQEAILSYVQVTYKLYGNISRREGSSLYNVYNSGARTNLYIIF